MSQNKRVQVKISRQDGEGSRRETVEGIAVGPGLAVTRGVGACTDLWRITHRLSGASICQRGFLSEADALTVARAVKDCINWKQDVAAVVAAWHASDGPTVLDRALDAVSTVPIDGPKHPAIPAQRDV